MGPSCERRLPRTFPSTFPDLPRPAPHQRGALTGPDELVKALTKTAIGTALEEEMTRPLRGGVTPVATAHDPRSYERIGRPLTAAAGEENGHQRAYL